MPESTGLASTKTSAPQAIPWIDDPAATLAPLPDPNRQITHAVLYRPCTAADLTGRFGHGGAGMGSASEFVSFVNTSRTPCSLAGAPVAITNVEANGTQQRLSLGPAGFGLGLDAVANLQPGGAAQTMLWESDECAAFQHPVPVVRVVFRLPDNSDLRVVADPAKYEAPVDCGLSASWFGTPHHQLPEPVYPTDPLVVTVTVPKAATAGASLEYTVTLTNPTGKAVPLSPCPSYQEVLFQKPDPHPVQRVYRLNCAGHPQVEAGESLVFAMRIPASKPPGMTELSWDLQRSNVGAGALLTLG